MIDKSEEEEKQLQSTLAEAEAELQDTESLQKTLGGQFDELVSYAALYEKAGIEAKKMIVSALIRRVEVGKDYTLNIEFNMNLKDFFCGLDYPA